MNREPNRPSGESRASDAKKPPIPKSAGRVARPSDEIEEEEIDVARADGRIHAQSSGPVAFRGGRR